MVIAVASISKTDRIKVEPLQPTVCKRCWRGRAVNSVTIAGSSPYAVPYCQPCTNAVITNHSTRLAIEDEANLWRFYQARDENKIKLYITHQLRMRIRR